MRNPKRVLLALFTVLASACTTVGPDYVRPDSPLGPDWYEAEHERFDTSIEQQVLWWETLGDPVLNNLITLAHKQNNNLQIAGLRVLESRAQLGIAVGQQYPQTQVAFGDATAVQGSENAANTAAGDLQFTQFNVGASASWEIDFWGKFRRGIESADAAYFASVAGYDQAMILVTAQVCSAYLAIRTLEEQERITNSNIAIQQRSFDIVDVQYKNGATSELDVLQAQTLLMATKATLPALEADLYQAKHALATLLGMPPSDMSDLLKGSSSIPKVPAQLAIGLPADLLRRRPDVRQAEFLAMAQNAQVGLAEANLYPSFSLTGTVGLTAAGNTDTTRTGDSGFGALFSGDSLTYSFGPSFVWPFLNYDRLKNNVRVQDARLQQSLIAYREAVLQAAREVEDAMVALDGAIEQDDLLRVTVESAQRSADVAQLRFNEGFADYQRVLNAQQSLFTQQARYVTNYSSIASNFIALYLALGGGWELRDTADMIDAQTLETMQERTNWGDLIEEETEQ